MYALPNHLFVKSLKEDFKKSKYSEWERSNSRDWHRNKTKAPSWVILPPVPNKYAGSTCECDPDSGREDSGTFLDSHKKTPTDRIAGKSPTNTGHGETVGLSKSQPSRQKRNETVELNPITLKKKENIKTLQFLILSRKKALKELEKHCVSLLEDNVRMAENIKTIDRNSLSNAREFLIQHEKLKSSITAFINWSQSQSGQTRTELKDAEEALMNRLQGLREQLRGVQAELVKAQAERHNLNIYKDNEHHVNALRIAEMTAAITKLKETQQDQNEDVHQLYHTEMVNLERRSQRKEQEILSLIGKQKVSYIPLAVKLMASHNQTMKKEIGIHKKEIAELENNNRDLIKSIEELQLSRANIRKYIFQDVFSRTDKCTPDMEVILNIPCEPWIPI
ncbi:hypothetical protein UPYG_G00167510 [Umbra pygmaea]|uniref:Uncharacterized protein n=1 Tax=Umbra pygmaea TaxID=75934 RepID=A0ABD0WMV8_UMBPY